VVTLPPAKMSGTSSLYQSARSHSRSYRATKQPDFWGSASSADVDVELWV